MGSDQRQQAGDIRRYRARQIGCDAARLATAAFVEDRNPRLKAGAVLGEGGTGHRTRKDQMRGLGQAPEGLSPGGRIGREARTGDGDQPSAGGQTRERRAQMPGCRLSAAGVDIRHRREWRVHQDGARAQIRVEMIVDLCSVEASDRPTRKQSTQEISAGVGQLVQREAAARDFYEDRQKACSGRWLQHQIARGDLCCSQCRQPHGQRRRELR